MTQFIIILMAAALAVVSALAVYSHMRVRTLRQTIVFKNGLLESTTSTNERLQDKVVDYLALCRTMSGCRYVTRCEGAAVSVLKEARGRTCCIKVFYDDDADYNLRCASELIDKLNE